jgi:putative transposase
MEVSTSGYYAWRSASQTARAHKDAGLLVQIKGIHASSKKRYGGPRIHADLRLQGVLCSLNRVARVMRLHNIFANKKRRYKVTTESGHPYPIAGNTLARGFKVSGPNQVWVSDITYLWSDEGWLYLAVVIDLFNREVVGWSMKRTLETPIVIDALTAAINARKPPAGLMHHSDRGSQYASNAYQELLRDNGMVCSMSRKGNCWDNAVAESFFATLKKELIRNTRFRTRNEQQSSVFEYIEVWYNRKRLHSTLGYLSPAQYLQQFVQQKVHQTNP